MRFKFDMKISGREHDADFAEAVRGLLAGDFSRLAPLFESPAKGSPCAIIRWYEDGHFDNQPQALAEAFTCACFNGCVEVVTYLLGKGIAPDGGMLTGLNAFHWAADRGQLEVVELLIRHGASLEARNMYGGTVLGCTVWSILHEPRPRHVQTIEALLKAGANPGAVAFPSGDDRVDDVLRRYRVA